MSRKGQEKEGREGLDDDATVVRTVKGATTGSVPLHSNFSQRAVVHISSAGVEPRHMDLAQRDHIIGRSADVDISLLDESISRQHAVILYRDEDFVLKDMDSKNGTFLNGTAVHECPLHSGDVIQIGNHSLRFLIEGAHSVS